MDLLKRILGILVIAISVVFIIACFAGVVFSWSINTPTTNAITGVLGGIERVLTTADTGLERVNSKLGDAQTAVDTIEQNVETAGETLSETNVVYEVLDRTVGDELFPKVEAIGDTIVAIRDAVVSFNDILESANDIPFVEVPTLTEELNAAAENMEDVRANVQETRDELQEIKEEAISKPVTAITDRTTLISDGLENVQGKLSNTQTNIGDSAESVSDIKARVPGLIDLISIVLSFIFLWLAFGQVGLIVLSYGYVKGPQESEEAAEKIVETYEEE